MFESPREDESRTCREQIQTIKPHTRSNRTQTPLDQINPDQVATKEKELGRHLFIFFMVVNSYISKYATMQYSLIYLDMFINSK
jgi:hypothetical protein